jgi:hypothetical protein
MKCVVRHVIYSLSLAFLATVVTFGQSSKHRVNSPECPFIEEETILELTDLRVAGKKIPFDQPFDADSKWLNTLVFRVKNIGHKPIAGIVLTFGLLERIDEELGSYASFDYGLQFVQRTGPVGKRTRSKLGVLVRPGREVDLTSEGCIPYGLRHLDQLLSREKQTRDSVALTTASGARFRKVEVMGADVQFTDGTVGRAQLLVRRKCEEK